MNTVSGLDSVCIEENTTTLELSQIVPYPEQPRKFRDEKALQELADSIKANGVIHPILVRQGEDGKYIIVSGERRWMASQLIGKTTILARIVLGEDYEIIALSENLARKDLLAIEESMASAKLLGKMQGSDSNSKQKELAAKLGIAESTMSEILKPAALSDEIKQEALTNPLWSRSKLLKLVKIKDHKEQRVAFGKMKKVIQTKISAKMPIATGDKDTVRRSRVQIAAAGLAKETEHLGRFVEEKYLSRLTSEERDLITSRLQEMQQKIQDVLDRMSQPKENLEIPNKPSSNPI